MRGANAAVRRASHGRTSAVAKDDMDDGRYEGRK